MPSDAGEIRVAFRVFLIPERLADELTMPHGVIDGGTTEIRLRLDVAPRPPATRDADLDAYVARIVRDRADTVRQRGLGIPSSRDPEHDEHARAFGLDLIATQEADAERLRDAHRAEARGAQIDDVDPGLAAEAELHGITMPTPRDVPHRARRATFPGS